MPVTQLVFIACPAFVGRINGETACEFHLNDKDYNEATAIPVDLAQTVRSGVAWENVQVDANVTEDPPGLTSIGPTFHVGSHKGAAYLEMGYYKKLQDAGKLANWPPSGDRPYQYQSVLRKDQNGVCDRFHGFHAEVLAASGSLANVAIYGVGTTEPQKSLWLDLNDPTTCDPPSRELTTITPQKGSAGALFLHWNTISSANIRMIKMPESYGTGTLPGKWAP